MTKARIIRARTACGVLGAIAALGTYGGLSRRAPVPRPAGVPQPKGWREFRTAWRVVLPSDNGLAGDDIAVGERSLLYLAAQELVCLDSESGSRRWSRRLADPQRRRYSAAGARRLYLAEALETDGGLAPRTGYAFEAFDTTIGRSLWRQHHPFAAAGPPCPAGNLLIVATARQELAALDGANGRIVWRRPLPRGPAPDTTYDAADALVRVEGGTGAVATGERFVGFDVRTGRRRWVYPREPASEPSEFSIDEKPGAFELHRNVVFGFHAGFELVALDAATGRRLWGRRSNYGSSPGPRITSRGDLLICAPIGHLTALRAGDGRTAWIRPAGRSAWWDDGAPSVKWGGELLLVRREPPRIRGAAHPLPSVDGVDTLVALDPVTGRERWSWQDPRGEEMDRLFPQGPRLIVAGGGSIRAVEPGPSEGPPADPLRRRWLASQCIRRLQWNARRQADPLEEAVEQAGGVIPSLARLPPFPIAQQPGDKEARLTLLALGPEAVPPLIAEAEIEARRIDALARPGSRVDAGEAHFLRTLLTLLVDAGGRGAVPALLSQLGHSRTSLTRAAFAECLVQLGDPLARPDLFRYCASTGEDSIAQRAALFFLCRSTGGEPDQAAVTRFLRKALADPNAPRWLRCMAQFELLNDRGAAARLAALAAFHPPRTVPLIPHRTSLRAGGYAEADPQTGFPSGFRLEFYGRAGDGTWWAGFTDDYLGSGEDVWLARSRDRRSWTGAVFAFSTMEFRRRGEALYPAQTSFESGAVVYRGTRWPRGGRPRRQWEVRFPLAEVLRDTDRDGLTDRLELRIGTDPGRRDTNGNGVPDGVDPNPLRHDPVISDEAAIYRAVLEALYRMNAARAAPAGDFADEIPELRTARPVPLPLPPGCRGLELRGPRGAVVRPTPTAPGLEFLARRPLEGCSFDESLLDLEGRPRAGGDTLADDPFTPQEVVGEKPFRFREFFPYDLSSAGDRARVSVHRVGRGRHGSAEPSQFEIEVRRINGEWLPVECRKFEEGEYAMLGLKRRLATPAVR